MQNLGDMPHIILVIIHLTSSHFFPKKKIGGHRFFLGSTGIHVLDFW